MIEEDSRPTTNAGPYVLGGIAVLFILWLFAMPFRGAAWMGWDGWGPTMHASMMFGGSSSGSYDAPAPAVDGATTLTVSAQDLFFVPARLVVPDGSANITVENDGRVLHDLTIPDLGFQLIVGPGETATGALVDAPAGEYSFECTVPGHAAAGMTGTIIITS